MTAAHLSTATHDRSLGRRPPAGHRADTRADRRARRDRMAVIDRELSTYTSPAELHELDAIVARAGTTDEPEAAAVVDRIRRHGVLARAAAHRSPWN